MLEDVLVLNANFEPLNICGMHRAIGMLVCHKATMVLNGRGFIKTSINAYPRPQVKLTRREVFRRDNYTCQYCGRHTSDLTIDHVIPRRLGGQHEWTNVVTACSYCNHKKGGRMLQEANMRLRQHPYEPPASLQYIFAHHLNRYNEWEPFVNGW
jgi:5-methylcytosine-specific restriction endonuclease McrA